VAHHIFRMEKVAYGKDDVEYSGPMETT